MSKEPQIQENEVKTKVAKRVPPGDRWAPLSNTTVILDSLTDVLEFIYQDLTCVCTSLSSRLRNLNLDLIA